jgi:DNA-binding MarR family transcriptional regulator
MKLEEEIQQKEFKTEQQKLSINISFTANWLNGFGEKLFKEYNLTPQQFNVLRILRGQHPKPASIKFIKVRMIDKHCDASRLVDNLVKKRFAERNVSNYDRRQCDVMITINGFNVLSEIDKHLPEYERHLSNLTDGEMKTLNHLLDKLRG